MTINYSTERREHALRVIRAQNIVTDTRLTYESRLTFALGTLVCNDDGVIDSRELKDAFKDPSAVAAARELLRKAGE